MVIYVDILLITNTMLSYCLLKCTQRLCGTKAPFWRMAAATLAAGASSLLLLLPPMAPPLRILVNGVCYFLTFVILCVPCKRRLFLRHVLWYAAQNMLLCGLVYAICLYTNTKRFAINNGAVYIHVQPLLLIGCALVVYLALSFAQLLLGRTVPVLTYRYTLQTKNDTIHGTAFLDTGFTAQDVFHECPVVLLDFAAVTPQLSAATHKSISEYYLTRQIEAGAGLFLLPMSTVAGQTLVPCLRAEKLTLQKEGEKEVTFSCVTAAFSAQPLAGGTQSALLGSTFFEKL